MAVTVLIAVGIGAAALLLPDGSDPAPTGDATCTALSETTGLDAALAALDTEAIESQLVSLERAEDTAPEEIDAALATLTTFLDELVEALAGVDANGRPEALRSALAARQDRIDTVTDAGASISAWAESNCGIGL